MIYIKINTFGKVNQVLEEIWMRETQNELVEICQAKILPILEFHSEKIDRK